MAAEKLVTMRQLADNPCTTYCGVLFLREKSKWTDYFAVMHGESLSLCKLKPSFLSKAADKVVQLSSYLKIERQDTVLPTQPTVNQILLVSRPGAESLLICTASKCELAAFTAAINQVWKQLETSDMSTISSGPDEYLTPISMTQSLRNSEAEYCALETYPTMLPVLRKHSSPTIVGVTECNGGTGNDQQNGDSTDSFDDNEGEPQTLTATDNSIAQLPATQGYYRLAEALQPLSSVDMISLDPPADSQPTVQPPPTPPRLHSSVSFPPPSITPAVLHPAPSLPLPIINASPSSSCASSPPIVNVLKTSASESPCKSDRVPSELPPPPPPRLTPTSTSNLIRNLSIGNYPSVSYIAEENFLFYGDHLQAYQTLVNLNLIGCFLVRRTKAESAASALTLCVWQKLGEKNQVSKYIIRWDADITGAVGFYLVGEPIVLRYQSLSECIGACFKDKGLKVPYKLAKTTVS